LNLPGEGPARYLDSEGFGEADADPEALRAAYLAAQPKAGLYVDLPDFAFMRLAVESVSYNGGFGRAYAIGWDELSA
jgi:putative heme iron utilization protein